MALGLNDCDERNKKQTDETIDSLSIFFFWLLHLQKYRFRSSHYQNHSINQTR